MTPVVNRFGRAPIAGGERSPCEIGLPTFENGTNPAYIRSTVHMAVPTSILICAANSSGVLTVSSNPLAASACCTSGN